MAKVIKAKKGHYLYNGENFVKVITLATDADDKKWQEVDQAFYNEKHPEPEEAPAPEQ